MNSGVLPEWDVSNKRWNAFFTEEMASRMVAPEKKKGVRKRRRRMRSQCRTYAEKEPKLGMFPLHLAYHKPLPDTAHLLFTLPCHNATDSEDPRESQLNFPLQSWLKGPLPSFPQPEQAFYSNQRDGRAAVKGKTGTQELFHLCKANCLEE